MNSKLLLQVSLIVIFLVGWTRTLLATETPTNTDKGVSIQCDGLTEAHAVLERRIHTAPVRNMTNGGLAGAMGGAHVRVTATKPQQILLPIPQLVDGQIPLVIFIAATPSAAVNDFRLFQRDDGNVVVGVHLVGNRQEVRINWASLVLITPKYRTPNQTPLIPYREATACVQAKAAPIQKLATDLWPDSEQVDVFAAKIQEYIRNRKRPEPSNTLNSVLQRLQRLGQPRTLDAVGILESGENTICTANANLAAALLRSKGIACRSVAVIPTISQRLEMHRIVEYAERTSWIAFDPSSVHTDIPAKPWQNIIMAKTTPQDEQLAMQPRTCAMLGCPYGQEIELLTSGVSLTGQDFFWTLAKPLIEFEPPTATSQCAAKAWLQFLATGSLTTAQHQATTAQTAADLDKLFVDE